MRCTVLLVGLLARSDLDGKADGRLAFGIAIAHQSVAHPVGQEAEGNFRIGREIGAGYAPSGHTANLGSWHRRRL